MDGKGRLLPFLFRSAAKLGVSKIPRNPLTCKELGCHTTMKTGVKAWRRFYTGKNRNLVKLRIQ